ncbi:MAG TPA: hypothetical protein VM327_05510 [Candidatus Thermoplasmatota archaeon]|nr:hypothetical protein [Candidatus Thermoplasmatota archaeon]
MRAAVLTLPLLGLILAGCAGDDGGVPAQAPEPLSPAVVAEDLNDTASLPALPTTLQFQDCLQLHTFFPFPMAVFTQLGFQLPPGFKFASEDGQTVDAFLAWWFCPGGQLNDGQNEPFEVVGSMVASLPVIPPSDLAARDPDPEAVRLDLVPLTWVVSNQLAARFLDEIPGLAGGYVENGDVDLAVNLDGGAIVSRGMTAHASFGTFDVDAVFQAAPAENPPSRYRLWLWPDGGEVTTYLGIANGPGQTLGLGEADLRFQGDADTGAPPATVGDSHVVDKTGVVMVAVPLDP